MRKSPEDMRPCNRTDKFVFHSCANIFFPFSFITAFWLVVVVVWQLSCRGSYHFLKRDCVADAVPLYQYTHWNWYSFSRPR